MPLERDEPLLSAFTKGQSSSVDVLVFPYRAGTLLHPNNLAHCYFMPVPEKARMRKFTSMKNSLEPPQVCGEVLRTPVRVSIFTANPIRSVPVGDGG